MEGVSRGKLHKCWFPAGAAAVLFMALPYLLLGGEAIFAYFDQLDGEVIGYLLQAKHIFDGSLPEFMGGAPKTALTPPAPACILLFLGGNAFAALVAMQVLGSLCGYLGMYLLAEKAGAGEGLAAAVGVLYAYLPFLPVYGLAQYGLPLLLWCMLQLGEGKHVRPALAYSALYALCSSLVLVGFGCLGALAVWVLVECIRHRKGWKRLGLAWLLMFIVYVAENGSLLGQLLGFGGAGASHKAEYVLAAEPFWEGFKTALLQGVQHSGDYHVFILCFTVAVLLAACAVGILKAGGGLMPEEKRLGRWIVTALGCNLCLAAAAAFWNGGAGIALRQRLGALGAFQADRVLWMAPCLWYFLLACAGALSGKLSERGAFWGARKQPMAPGGAPGRTPVATRLVRAACALVLAAVLGITGVQIFWHSNLKPNLRRLMNSDYRAFSYNDYYAVGVLEQVEAYIRQTTGESVEEYRVASLGIDPAAALYHGFYCLDGYSNNYSLEYKHAFREIIAPELAKSDYLKDYYDNWGNRCYLFSAECPAYYTVEKGGFYFQNYELDVEALRGLGGKYILSAAYISNAEEQGLALLREEPFETEDSYYRIFLYTTED